MFADPIPHYSHQSCLLYSLQCRHMLNLALQIASFEGKNKYPDRKVCKITSLSLRGRGKWVTGATVTKMGDRSYGDKNG